MFKMSHHACVRGVVIDKGKILVVEHSHPDRPPFWCFPGGHVEENETLVEAVKRELKEETHLDVDVGQIVFVQEFFKEHLIELFFECSILDGEAKLGIDPDNPGMPILTKIKWVEPRELLELPVYPQALSRILFENHRNYPKIGFQILYEKEEIQKK